MELSSSSSSPISPNSLLYWNYFNLLLLRPILAISFVLSFILLGWVLAWKLVLVHVPLIQEIFGLRKKPVKPKPTRLRRFSRFYNDGINATNSDADWRFSCFVQERNLIYLLPAYKGVLQWFRKVSIFLELTTVWCVCSWISKFVYRAFFSYCFYLAPLSFFLDCHIAKFLHHMLYMVYGCVLGFQVIVCRVNCSFINRFLSVLEPFAWSMVSK